MKIARRISVVSLLILIILITGCRGKGPDMVFNPVDLTPNHLNFTPQHVEIQGDYAYVASKSNGVNIFDITDRLNPDWIANVKTTGSAMDIFAQGDYAYVADTGAGLQVVDISDPENAKIVQTVEITGVANGVTVSGGYAFVAAGEGGLQVIDIDPLDMAYVVREVPTESEALNVKVYRNDAYIGCSEGLYIANVEDPEKALLINTNMAKESYGEFDIKGDYAFFAHANGLDLIYVKKPKWAYVKSAIEPWDDETEAAKASFLSVAWFNYQKDEQRPADEKKGKVKAFTSVACYGNYVIAGGYNRVLHIIDVSDPQKPRLANKIMGYAPAQSITISGKYAWVAEPDVGIVVVDMSSPRYAKIATIVATPRPKSIDVEDGYAYLAADELGLQIVDVDPVESSYLVKTLDTGGLVSSVKYHDGYVYAIDYAKGLQIIKVSDPVNAEVVNTLEVPRIPAWVGVGDGVAYVFSRGMGLSVVDIDPPEMASIMSQLKLPDLKYNVVCTNSGDFVYLIGCKKRLQVAQTEEVASSILNVVDVSNPESPWIHDSLDMDFRGEFAVQDGDCIYITDTADNLLVVDVDPPELSKVMKTIRLGKHVAGNTTCGSGYTFTGIYGGLLINDIDPLMLAHFVNTIKTYGDVTAVDIQGNRAYIADTESGFRVVRLWDDVVEE